MKKNDFRELLIKDNLEDFNQQVEKKRKEYFCIENEPEIEDQLKKDEFSITELIQKLEKENKEYLEKNNQKSYQIIKFTHYNNRYIYTELQEEVNQINNSISSSTENDKNLLSKIINSDITLPE